MPKYRRKVLPELQLRRLERDLEELLEQYGGYPSVERNDDNQIVIYTDLYAEEE